MSLLPKIPTLGRWGFLVENFSARNLTFEQDVGRAFAGATEIMGATFPGGLHHGFPVFFFDIAMLWQPESSLIRRPNAPSWSWAGWKGSVECLEHWFPYYPGVWRKSGQPVDWVAQATLRPVARYRLPSASDGDGTDFNGFYHYQGMRADPHATLPNGWTRHTHLKGDYYAHTSKGDNDFRYSYPLPIATSTVQKPTNTPSSPILLCTAPIATLSFGPIEEHIHDASVSLSIFFNDHRIGAMTLHEPYDRTAPEWKKNRVCEAVAISEAEVPDDYGESKENGTADPGRGRIYNVLWIEWEGDVAYRKGIAAVGKDAWEGLEAEVRTFKLG